MLLWQFMTPGQSQQLLSAVYTAKHDCVSYHAAAWASTTAVHMGNKYVELFWWFV